MTKQRGGSKQILEYTGVGLLAVFVIGYIVSLSGYGATKYENQEAAGKWGMSAVVFQSLAIILMIVAVIVITKS
jgi:hypothetical protein